METQTKHIIRFLKNHIPELMGIYLFGSFADGTDREDSDLDLAILCKYPYELPPLQLYQLQLDLGYNIQQEVDLIDLQTANTDFRFQVISTGKRIYCSDEYYCDFFEMTAISMYQRLELERADIIEQFKERGKIYG